MKRQEKNLTLRVFAQRKNKGEKIVMVTAYDLTSAMIVSAGGADAILVGDSLGMVIMGQENTLGVTMDQMVHHCQAVQRAQPNIPVIADMPYGSFHVSVEDTVRNGLRLVKEGGAVAVKVEGGQRRLEVIQGLLRAEIPVMGHLGLTPQSVNRLGGYRVQGRDSRSAELMLQEARLLQQAGCLALVLECVPSPLAEQISRELDIPTIGIGAGAGCDGQVLVFHDLLGLFDGLSPKFVKRYADLGAQARQAIATYAAEVRAGVFPGPQHGYDSLQALAGDEGGPAPQPGQGRLENDPPRDPDSGYLANLENGKV